MISLENGRLTKRIFRWDMNRQGQGWANYVKPMLEMIGMEHCFINRSTIDIDKSSEEFHTVFENRWKHDINKKPKLRTYTQLKDSYKTEYYLPKKHDISATVWNSSLAH